jgi:hypothetical protein
MTLEAFCVLISVQEQTDPVAPGLVRYSWAWRKTAWEVALVC